MPSRRPGSDNSPPSLHRAPFRGAGASSSSVFSSIKGASSPPPPPLPPRPSRRTGEAAPPLFPAPSLLRPRRKPPVPPFAVHAVGQHARSAAGVGTAAERTWPGPEQRGAMTSGDDDEAFGTTKDAEASQAAASLSRLLEFLAGRVTWPAEEERVGAPARAELESGRDTYSRAHVSQPPASAPASPWRSLLAESGSDAEEWRELTGRPPPASPPPARPPPSPSRRSLRYNARAPPEMESAPARRRPTAQAAAPTLTLLSAAIAMLSLTAFSLLAPPRPHRRPVSSDKSELQSLASDLQSWSRGVGLHIAAFSAPDPDGGRVRRGEGARPSDGGKARQRSTVPDRSRLLSPRIPSWDLGLASG